MVLQQEVRNRTDMVRRGWGATGRVPIVNGSDLSHNIGGGGA